MGNYTDYFPAASGGGGVCPTYAIHTNCTGWVPPRDGCVLFHIFGAGSGGKSQANCGGGAGAYIRKAESVTTSQCYCTLIGTSAIPNGSYTMICQIGGGWCMRANGGCCDCGGLPEYFGATPNGTNETYTCGGPGASQGGGGAVHIFGSPGTTGYQGGANSGCGGGGGGAGVGGNGGNARNYCCGVIPGGGGGSGDAANSYASLNDGAGKDTTFSHAGQGLWIIDTPYADMFKWVPCWGGGGSISQAGNSYWNTPCSTGQGYFEHAGIGGGGSGGVACLSGQPGGAFGGGGGVCASNSGSGGMGGFPGGGAGGSYWNCCFCTRGGDGVIFVEYMEV